MTLGSTYHGSATGSAFSRYAGGLDRFGGGGQPLPSSIPASALRRSSIFDPNGYTADELETFGETLVGNWTGSEISSAAPATNFAATFGGTYGRLGVVLSAVSNHSFDKTTETLRFFGLDAGGVLVPRNDYDLATDSETASTGFVGNLSLRLSDSHRLHSSSVMTSDASSEVRFQEGLNTNSGGFIRDHRSRYQVEEIRSHRLRGEHNFGGIGIGSLAEWSVAHSSATNESNLRENVYRESDPGIFALQLGDAASARLDFFDLEEEIVQGSGSWTLFYAADDGKRSGALKGGIDLQQRTRDFGARRFRFVTSDQQKFDLHKTPEQIFTAENIGPGGFEVREVTGVNDAYDAEHALDAAYVMADTTFGRWRLIGGARYEDSEQTVVTFNPFDIANEVRSVNSSSDILPSLNANYQATSRTNVRFAYGRSLNRPAFRELSPFAFVEITGGRSIVGNPELRQATIDGYDVRWETFPSPGEVIATSVFYKKIDQPIERIVQPTTELRTSFVNADAATLWGVELELRKSLGAIAPWLDRWAVNMNYAYIHSDVTVGEQQLSVVTNTERPLEGQSDQVGNIALQFYHPEWGSMVRLLASYSGPRLTDVGAYGLPDVYQDGYTSIDLVISQQILTEALDLKLTATNLLDAHRRFTQGSEIQRLYRRGRSFGLSLSYSPF